MEPTLTTSRVSFPVLPRSFRARKSRKINRAQKSRRKSAERRETKMKSLAEAQRRRGGSAENQGRTVMAPLREPLRVFPRSFRARNNSNAGLAQKGRSRAAEGWQGNRALRAVPGDRAPAGGVAQDRLAGLERGGGSPRPPAVDHTSPRLRKASAWLGKPS